MKSEARQYLMRCGWPSKKDQSFCLRSDRSRVCGWEVSYKLVYSKKQFFVLYCLVAQSDILDCNVVVVLVNKLRF